MGPLVQRLSFAGLALLLLAAAGTALFWSHADWEVRRAAGLLEAAGNRDRVTLDQLLDLRADLEVAIERRGMHPVYLSRLARTEIHIGRRLVMDDPVSAFASFNRAEQLALQAHAHRSSLPHDLLWAATARAERFQLDTTFEGYLTQARQLGPWDRGVTATATALVLAHWFYASEPLRALAFDSAEEFFGMGGDPANMRNVIHRAQAWPLFCEREIIREKNPVQCERAMRVRG